MMALESDLLAINYTRWYWDEAKVRAMAAFRCDQD